MGLETKTEPTETELRPIKLALKEQFTRIKYAPDDVINELAKKYYEIHGLSIHKNTIELIGDAYWHGYERARTIFSD